MKTRSCKHCGGMVATSAKICPHCGGSNSGTDLISSAASVIKVLFVVFVVLPFAYVCSQQMYVDDSGGSRTASATKPEQKKDPAQWESGSYKDEMSGGTATFASLKSTNTLNLSFPYDGTQRATLTFRDHPRYGKDVFIRLDKGQFTCSVTGCDVQVRWDNWQILTLKASEPSDGSSNTLFFSNYDRFLINSRKASEVRIQLPLYRQGAQHAHFDLSKLAWGE